MSIPSLSTTETTTSPGVPRALPPGGNGRAPSAARGRGASRRVGHAVLTGLRAGALGFLGAHWLLLVTVVSSLIAWSFLRPPGTFLMVYRAATTHQPVRLIRYVELKQVPRTARIMLIRLEDYTFYLHHGIDIQAIKDAAKVNKIIGQRLYGGSTITQQLARTLYLTTRKTYFRKYLEAIIAVTMEVILSKERILELYLNYVEWGPGVYGIGAAARYHFGKDVRSLTVDEYRRLFTLLSSPVRYTAWNFQQNRLLAERYSYLVSAFPSL